MLKEAVEWLGGTLSTKGISEELGHFHIYNERLYSSNGKLTASTPYKVPKSLDLSQVTSISIPGPELAAALKRLPDLTKIEFDLNSATFKIAAGRFRAAIPCLINSHNLIDTSFEERGKKKPVSEEFLSGLRLIRPFVSDDATHLWATGVSIRDGYLYGTNNKIIVRCPLGKTVYENCILPVWFVDFILDRADEIKDCWITEKHACFVWKNGSWVIGPMVAALWPDMGVKLVEDNAAQKPQPIAEEIRDTVERFDGLGITSMAIGPYGIRGKAEKGVKGEYTADIDLGDIKESFWSVPMMALVLKMADRIDYKNHPGPAFFTGKDVEGVMIGRTSL